MNMSSSNKGPAGAWTISNTVAGQTNETTMRIVEEDGQFTGTMVLGREQALSKVAYEKGELSFTVAYLGSTVEFKGTVNGDLLDGKIFIPSAGMEIVTTGTRLSETPGAVTAADAGEKEESESAPDLSPATEMLFASQDYDLYAAVAVGLRIGYERIKQIPRTPAELDITEMARTAGIETADDAVDYFIHRFLRVKLHESDRQLIISYMVQLSGGEKIDYDSPEAEADLRELLHSIMSTPEFQLG